MRQPRIGALAFQDGRIVAGQRPKHQRRRYRRAVGALRYLQLVGGQPTQTKTYVHGGMGGRYCRAVHKSITALHLFAAGPAPAYGTHLFWAAYLGK